MAGAILAVIGLWGTWIPHPAAALVLSGWDLTEFVKFLPSTSTIRELFYLPVWSAGVVMAVLAFRPSVGLPKRLVLIAFAGCGGPC